MRKNRTIYALAVVACFIFSIAYKSRISAVLLFAVIGYFFIALALTIVNLFLVKAGFTEQRRVCEKNAQFELGLFISNRSLTPCAPVELVCTIPDRDTGLFSRKRVYASLPPLGKSRLSVMCLHKYRGSYTAKLERIAVYDPLRIIRLSRKLKAEMTLVFLPRKISLGDLAAAASGERNLSQIKLLSGEREEFSHVREYKEGDVIQLVHWKLTAKADELMMKQFEETNERRALILCDYCFDSSDPNPLLRADSIIETAIAFAMSSVDAGVRATVDFGASENGFVSEISDRSSFDRFYDLMSVLPAKMEVCGLADLAAASARAAASVIFLVTARLNEDALNAAEMLSQSFGGLVVLAFVNLSDSPVPESAENGRFLFLNIRGDGEDALLNAVASLSEE